MKLQSIPLLCLAVFLAGCYYDVYSYPQQPVRTERPLTPDAIVFSSGGTAALDEYRESQAGAASVNLPPPPNRAESRPVQPARNAQWIDGFWRWGLDGWAWRPGYWVTGAVPGRWIAGQWRRQNSRWLWEPSYWERPSNILSAYAISELVAHIAPPLRGLSYNRSPRPSPTHLWVPGYWFWTDQGWDWVRGSWILDRPGCIYRNPSWQRRRDGLWSSPAPGWSCR